MRNINEIIINKVYIGGLDRESNYLTLPENEMELNEETYGYLEKHILRCIQNDEAKPGIFDGETNIVKELCKEIFVNDGDDGGFVISSKKLTQFIYKCMGNDENEPSGDFAVCLCDSQFGIFIAMLKLNYTNTYSHYISSKENIAIEIGINKTGLPGVGQRISRAVFIKDLCKDDEAYDFLIYDKDVESYFWRAFLRANSVRDSRENTKIIQRTSESFARRAFKDNAHEAEAFRKKLTETMINEDSLKVEDIVEQLLPTQEMRAEYEAALISQGIQETNIPIDREWAEKKLKRKRLKVDRTIELYIDIDAYNDKDKFEIKKNGDGTINIVLKNIRNYIEK